MLPSTFNLLAHVEAAATGETVDTLLLANGIRLERIVSHGQASPPGFWYDQSDAEWVVVVSGNAHLAIDGEANPRVLAAGDAVYLPAGCRHRVTWTDPTQPTVWLALFVDPGLQPSVMTLAAPRERDEA